MTDPETTETPAPPVTGMDLIRLRQRLLAEIQAGWYGGRPAVSPHGRRIYAHGQVQHLTMHKEPRRPPPPHEEGRAYLRHVLTVWRTTYAPVSIQDDADGGPIRRALVAAGMALAGPGVDGQERADTLVRIATMWSHRQIDRAIADLALSPVMPWDIRKTGGPGPD
ncbi:MULTISPECIES: hypothetical protein [unclassified Methylobacterium]|uniref:hypothetical protein n=1 Tax=unclassified Methylobacterium TaxID=2615210 RepID=UPI0011C1D9A5|nr:MULTISPECIES: hypothetical protein [unclassified Methylobacterium]QEE39837.1 hypothetical protein FVA80_13615 [Methylobacterium sp. WL1]TXN57319.1 hypothetical protein FV241_11695 [Methylobacterium sp. WL2]